MSQKLNEAPTGSEKYLQGKLENILLKINQEGEFVTSTISTLDGFAVAAVSSQESRFDEVVLAAISTIVQEASKKAQKFIGFKRMDEVSLVDDDKFRMVCREFSVGEDRFILTSVVPPYKTYRRLTNIAIREIEKILEEREEIINRR
jgi:predicted regulator of Ras-like GTPase activity (Roadblock/LC7/MglB family)